MIDQVEFDSGNSPHMGLHCVAKGIRKRLLNAPTNDLSAIDWHWVFQVELEESQVVKTGDMVLMFVRIDHRMQDANFFAQQLGPQIGRRIDQQVSIGQTQNGAAARSLISRMPALANATSATQCRHTYGGASTQQDHPALDISRFRLGFHIGLSRRQTVLGGEDISVWRESKFFPDAESFRHLQSAGQLRFERQTGESRPR
jgi:hypothetical protein